MIVVLCAAALCAVSLFGLRQVFAGGVSVVLRGFDGIGALAGFAIASGAALVFGPVNSLAVVLALLIHEAGHWAALRLLPATDPVFRLFPILTGARGPSFRHDESRVLHALMAPGLSVAPMVLTLAIAQVSGDTVREFCQALALTLATLGAATLLPFDRLPGGLVARATARVLSPAVWYLALACAVAGLALAGWITGQPAAHAAAMLGLAAGLLPRPETPTRPMRTTAATLAVGTWAATFLAHVSGAALLLLGQP